MGGLQGVPEWHLDAVEDDFCDEAEDAEFRKLSRAEDQLRKTKEEVTASFMETGWCLSKKS